MDAYTSRFFDAVQSATSYLRQKSHIDRISGQPEYRLRVVLPGDPDVHLTYAGEFKADKQIISAAELPQFVIRSASAKRSTSPSRLPVSGILEHMLNEVRNIPKLLALEDQGRLHETKELLRV